MATTRSYGDGCSIARALDLVGERWALLVVRELLLGPKRFTDLRRGLPNASPNVLSERLRELEGAGIVRRGRLAPPAGSRVYELTDRGLDLEDVVMALGRWAAPAPQRGAPIVSADSIVLALRARFQPGAPGSGRVTVALHLGDDRFRIEVTGDAIDAARGDAPGAVATIDTDPDTLGAVLWGGRPLSDARRTGALTIEGDAAAVRRFLRLFPMPASTTPVRRT